MTRRLAARVAAALALAAACGEPDPPVVAAAPIAAVDLALEIAADATEVELGQAFGLTVVSRSSVELEVEPWDEAQLAPLVVRLVAATRRENGTHREATWRYRAHAFAPGELEVPAPFVRARARDGALRVAYADELRLAVRSALAPDDAGVAELPGGVLPPPRDRWSALAVVAAVLALLLGAAWFGLRRARQSGPAAPAPEDPDAAALARLGELRALDPQGRAAIHADSIAAAAVVRAWLDARFALRATAGTTEEIGAGACEQDALRGASGALLTGFLAHCDLVKFACLTPAAAERERRLREVESCVRALAPDRNGAR